MLTNDKLAISMKKGYALVGHLMHNRIGSQTTSNVLYKIKQSLTSTT